MFSVGTFLAIDADDRFSVSGGLAPSLAGLSQPFDQLVGIGHEVHLYGLTDVLADVLENAGHSDKVFVLNRHF